MKIVLGLADVVLFASRAGDTRAFIDLAKFDELCFEALEYPQAADAGWGQVNVTTSDLFPQTSH